MLATPVKIRTLQRKLYAKAKQEPGTRFYALYDKVYRVDILQHAYRLVRSKKGAPGIDGVSFAAIEAEEGVEQFLVGLAKEVKSRTYRPLPVRRVMIPKPDGNQRPLGIPTIEDKVLQESVRRVLTPVYEEEFKPFSYGFRSGRGAHDAIDYLFRQVSYEGMHYIIDADIKDYFGSIDHGMLRGFLDRRVKDGVIRRAIGKWLKAGILEEGQIRYPKEGTPQGGVISPC